jgi:hypothetical protein
MWFQCLLPRNRCNADHPNHVYDIRWNGRGWMWFHSWLSYRTHSVSNLRSYVRDIHWDALAVDVVPKLDEPQNLHFVPISNILNVLSQINVLLD